jgi:hypothetical protein
MHYMVNCVSHEYGHCYAELAEQRLSTHSGCLESFSAWRGDKAGMLIVMNVCIEASTWNCELNKNM